MQNDASIAGAQPGSNQIKENEHALIEQKKDKVVEIFKASTEVHEILESAKREVFLADFDLDINKMLQLLFSDVHFINSKFPNFLTSVLVLGDLLTKRPGAKKVDQFMSKQL